MFWLLFAKAPGPPGKAFGILNMSLTVGFKLDAALKVVIWPSQKSKYKYRDHLVGN